MELVPEGRSDVVGRSEGGAPSELDLHAVTNALPRRNPEGVRRRRHERREPTVEPLTRTEHRLVGARDQPLLTEVEGEGRGIEDLVAELEPTESLDEVGLVHEAELDDDPMEAVAEILFQLQALPDRDRGVARRTDGEEEDGSTEGHGVLDVVRQHMGHALGVGRHEDGDTLGAGHVLELGVLGERGERQRVLGHVGREPLPPLAPGGHDEEDRQAHDDGNVGPVPDLGQVRAPERDVEDEEAARHESRLERRPGPALARDLVEEDRGDAHRGGDREAVGRRESRGRLEDEHERDTADHETPVERGDVDLPLRRSVGVPDRHPRGVAQLLGLVAHAEHPRDERLRGDDRRSRGDDDLVGHPPLGHHHEEGVEGVGAHRHDTGVSDPPLQEEGPLAEVGAEERRVDERVPRHGDGPSAEVTEVRVEGFAARDGEHDTAQDEEAMEAVLNEEARPVVRVDRREEIRVLDNPGQPASDEGDEPDGGGRPEDLADAAGASRLDQEEPEQDPDGDGHHVPLQEAHDRGRRATTRGRHDPDALDSREHRDSRGDDPLAADRRGPEEPSQDEPLEATLDAGSVGAVQHAREERERPPLATVVRLQHVVEVLPADRERERPEDE